MGKWYFHATNKPSGNDFYPNNRRVIIFLIWFLLLVIYLFYFFYLSFWILGFISMGLRVVTTTQTVAPKYFPDSCSGSDIFLGGVYGRLEARLVWFVWKKGVLILVLTKELSLMVITSNHHMKAAAASSSMASLHGWR